MSSRWFLLLPLLPLLLAAGCTMPCSKVLEDVDSRYGQLAKELRRSRDPGGDGYDLSLVVPGGLLDSSFQRMLDSGEIDKTHKTRVEIPLPNIPSEWSVQLRADLQEASFQPVQASEGARVQAHAVVRLRGTAGSELFDVTAAVDGPVEVFTRNSRTSSPELTLRIGDLEQSQMSIDGSVLGRAVRTELEGLIPRGGLRSILDDIGLGGSVGDLLDQLEEAFEDEVRKQLTTVVQTLLDDEVGDVKVMEIGAMQMGDLELTPTAVGLRSGDGWVALGLRSDLATGAGEIALTAPSGPTRGRIQMQVSERFLCRAVELAYVEGLMPRTFGDDGAASDEGPYHVEPLGIDLGDTTRVGVRVSRCEDPCGWAELWGDVTLDASDREALSVQVGEIEVGDAKGSGKLIELVLWHRDKVVGEPVEFVQEVSRMLRPAVAGQPLNLRVNRVSIDDDTLTLSLGYQMASGERSPDRKMPGRGERGTTDAKRPGR